MNKLLPVIFLFVCFTGEISLRTCCIFTGNAVFRDSFFAVIHMGVHHAVCFCTQNRCFYTISRHIKHRMCTHISKWHLSLKAARISYIHIDSTFVSPLKNELTKHLRDSCKPIAVVCCQIFGRWVREWPLGTYCYPHHHFVFGRPLEGPYWTQKTYECLLPCLFALVWFMKVDFSAWRYLSPFFVLPFVQRKVEYKI